MLLRPALLPFLALLPTLPTAQAWDCALAASGVEYDLTSLRGTFVAEQETDTPPTSSRVTVLADLCSADGIQREEGVPDEDQCPEKTRVCFKITNRKSSSSEPDRVVQVIPIWPVDLSDDDITTHLIGEKGVGGLALTVKGAEYAGTRQTLSLNLTCDTGAPGDTPKFVYYHPGHLTLNWASPPACPKTARSGDDSKDGEGEVVYHPRKGMGFGGFLKLVFWLLILGLLAYFVLGIFYNHQQYSARGWDLVPHRDFWREFPALAQDLFSHMFAGLRGGNRGGYSSLG